MSVYSSFACHRLEYKTFSPEFLNPLRTFLQNNKTIIRIYGLAGVGKGTLSEQLANTLDLPNIDTGRIWRAITYIYEYLNLEINNQNNKLVINELKLSLQNQQLAFNFRDRYLQTVDLKNPKIDSVIATYAGDTDLHSKFFELTYSLYSTILDTSFILDGRGAHPPDIIKAENNNIPVIRILLDASDEVKLERYHYSYTKKTPKQSASDEEFEILLQKNFDTNIIQRNLKDLETCKKLNSGLITANTGLIDTSNLTPTQVLDTALSFIKSQI